MTQKVKIRLTQDYGDWKQGQVFDATVENAKGFVEQAQVAEYILEETPLVVEQVDIDRSKVNGSMLSLMNKRGSDRANPQYWMGLGFPEDEVIETMKVAGIISNQASEAESEDHRPKRKVAKKAATEPTASTPEPSAQPAQTMPDDIDVPKVLRESYESIIRIVRKYSDLPDEYYPLISLWTIGTYFHSQFESYPLLFINATKGSGKSRLLKLIIAMSRSGKMVLDLREAVLFRTAKDHTIGIDEFEGVGSKDASTLRTMINAAYKKGNAVERMKKVTKNGQEEHVVERFDLYTPIAMANIWGMEEVLADRCVTIMLEKSDNIAITKLIEDFEQNPQISAVKKALNELQCSKCSVVAEKNVANAWNEYVLSKYQQSTTSTTLSTSGTLTTLTALNPEVVKSFDQIDATAINGRNLELFFPLFMVGMLIGDDIFETSLKLAEKIVTEKRSEEFTESKDVALLDFLSKQDTYRGSYIPIVDVTKDFKLFSSLEEEENKWLNSRWMTRALKRAQVVNQKRRMSRGVEVLVDIDKAKRKLTKFKEDLKAEPTP